MDYVEMVERIKEHYREEASGGCQMLSLGDGCECTLCLADNLRRHITELEERAGKYKAAMDEITDQCCCVDSGAPCFVCTKIDKALTKGNGE